MRQTQKEKLLPEQTAEKIRGYIEGNGLKVGDKLPNEFQLAEICGVGRSTVREAIKLLVFSGKVEVTSPAEVRQGMRDAAKTLAKLHK